MKLIKIFFLYLFALSLISACSSLKENLSLKKKQGVDEFLIEKKSPLTVPPDFTSLPKPKDQIEKKDQDNSIDLKKVLSESKNNEKVNTSNNLEKSISDILNKK